MTVAQGDTRPGVPEVPQVPGNPVVGLFVPRNKIKTKVLLLGYVRRSTVDVNDVKSCLLPLGSETGGPESDESLPVAPLTDHLDSDTRFPLLAQDPHETPLWGTGYDIPRDRCRGPDSCPRT